MTDRPFAVPVAPASDLNIVNKQLRFSKATQCEPRRSGFIHLAAEIDRVWPFGLGPTSRAKRAAVDGAITLARRLEQVDSVIRADVLVARFIPPGQGRELDHRTHVHPARFDLSVLIETTDPSAAAALQQDETYTELVSLLERHSRYLHVVRAQNARSLGDVDKTRDGVFLFNYFYADDTAKLLPVWEYTAGWFEAKTGLDNSTLLIPFEGEQSQYGIINHCRWDHWRDVLPDLRFRPTFRRYVLANFYANGIVPMPVLYRLASPSGRHTGPR
jgi:hypothetical protein